MSQENVELAYAVYETVRRQDIEAFLEFIDPEAEATSRLMEAEGVVYRGKEGARQYMEDIWSVFPDWDPHIASARSIEEETVLVELSVSGHGINSGIAVRQTFWQVIRGRDGKAISFHSYASEAEALEAAGVSES